jgi:hypothetical protein
VVDGDIWDNLDAGFMGIFTVQKGPWSLAVEGVYMILFMLAETGQSTAAPFVTVPSR